MIDKQSEHRAGIYKFGRQCLRHLTKDRNWGYWSGVITALGEARTEAFERSGTNRPGNSAYNAEFGAILDREKLHNDVLVSTTRNHCLQIAERWVEVETWRKNLPPHQQQEWNHPSTIWRHFQKATVPPAPKIPKPTRRDEERKWQEEIALLYDHIARLNVRITELIEENAALREKLGLPALAIEPLVWPPGTKPSAPMTAAQSALLAVGVEAMANALPKQPDDDEPTTDSDPPDKVPF